MYFPSFLLAFVFFSICSLEFFFFLKMRSNALSWNPMEAFNFTVANEDQNCYTFDMRKLGSALKVHTDHLGAVFVIFFSSLGFFVLLIFENASLDIDYSPTGQEFVTGSYDKTIRIFSIHSKGSREVYHTSRMQRIFASRFSADANYVFSASEDTNVRIWKAKSSRPIGILNPRQKQSLEYQEKLKERYKDVPEIRRIAKHKHLPRPLKVARDQKRAHDQSLFRKERNRVEASKGKLKMQLVKKKA